MLPAGTSEMRKRILTVLTKPSHSAEEILKYRELFVTLIIRLKNVLKQRHSSTCSELHFQISCLLFLLRIGC
jgi:hypothetical protein